MIPGYPNLEDPMKWITRENAAVDRIACPWLIRRFVDQDAEFLFVPADRVRETAEREGATPFDVEGAKLGHVDGRCSFESIVLEYGLERDPALALVSQIIHGADITEDADLSPESRGLKAIASGFRLLHGRDDHRKIDLETPMYDALYAWAKDEHARTGRGTPSKAGAAG
jgi:hypothetical protein